MQRKAPIQPGHIAIVLSAALTPGWASAAGFALLEQSGSGTGVAYAGIAASGDDPSVLFFNPASLSLMKSAGVAVAAHGINISAEFNNQASALPPAGLGALPAGSTINDAGDFAPVPNVYLAWPLQDRITLGLGVNAPFGLVTEYDDPWIGRFQGIRTELMTVNVNPALSYKVSDQLALGVGLNYQYADAELSNAVLLGPAVEGRALVDVNDDAFGWNVGALYTLPTNTRIGVSYRSKMDYDLDGDTTVTTLAGTPVAAVSGDTQVEASFPDSAFLSVAHPLNGRMELRGDVSWTNWSRIGTLFAVNPANGQPRDVLNFAFEDSYRVALGGTYAWNDKWSLRAGTAWDESPVKDDTRTVRLPDGDRVWLSLGARWLPRDNMTVDFGYTHLFVDDQPINVARPQLGLPAAFTSTVVGEYENAIDLVSLQFAMSFQ